MNRFSVVGVAIVSATLSAPSRVAAQPAVSAAFGAASYDLSGVGTTGVGALRIEWPLAWRAQLQVGGSFLWYTTQADDEVAFLTPEAGLLVRPLGGVPLLVGLGAGHTLVVKGGGEDDFTVHATVGLDLEDRGGWAVRPEVRLRAIDPWAGTVGEFLIGFRRRLGSG